MDNVDKSKKTKIIRIVILVLFVVFTLVLTYLMFPIIKNLRTDEGRNELQKTVKSSGAFAPLVYSVMCGVQVIIALLPGEPFEVVGGLLFGTFGGLALCVLGIALGQVVVYYLVRWIGKPLIDAIMSKENYNKLKFLNNEKSLELIIFILFLIPGTPKDALTYFIPVTKIKPSKYFVMTALARVPSIVTSTYVGANISQGKWFVGVIILVVTGAIGLVGILCNNRIMDKIKAKKEKSKKI